MPIFVVSRLFALLIEKRTRHAVVGVLIDCASKESSGGGGGAVSLEPSLPPLKNKYRFRRRRHAMGCDL